MLQLSSNVIVKTYHPLFLWGTEVPLRRSALSVCLWGDPLGDTPPTRKKLLLGPYEAPKETDTKVTSAKGPFFAYGRFPKFHLLFLGPRPWHIEIRHRVKKHPQLICSDLRLSNWKFEDWNYGNRPYPTFAQGPWRQSPAVPERVKPIKHAGPCGQSPY